jgi:hypothetical protein
LETYYSKGVDAIIYGLAQSPDPVIDDLHDKFLSSMKADEVQNYTHDTDKRIIEQFYSIWMLSFKGYTYWQPYLKGYSDENLGWGQQILWSRIWVDSAMKTTMGR